MKDKVNGLRICRGKYIDGRATACNEKCFTDGKFHCWGQDFIEYESGPANFTVAVIELEDGKIVFAYPRDIEFV